MNITLNDKKEFIRYFLNNYQLRRREAVWILNYLMRHDKLIEKVHFVEDANLCPRGIIMSTHCTDMVPFRFYKDNTTTTDAEKSFHDIKLNEDEDLYIQINFNDKMKNDQYMLVLEDNPFESKVNISKDVSKIVQDFLEYCLVMHRKDKIKQEIDQALGQRKKRVFNKLVKEYNQISIPEMKHFKIIKSRH